LTVPQPFSDTVVHWSAVFDLRSRHQRTGQIKSIGQPGVVEPVRAEIKPPGRQERRVKTASELLETAPSAF
jgi:hypothetical protein